MEPKLSGFALLFRLAVAGSDHKIRVFSTDLKGADSVKVILYLII